MAALQLTLCLQRSSEGKALLLLTSPEGRRSDSSSGPKGSTGCQLGSVMGSTAQGTGWDPALLQQRAAHPNKPGGQLETSQLPGPKSGDIKLNLSSSGAETGAEGATVKRKGSRQNQESSR